MEHTPSSTIIHHRGPGVKIYLTVAASLLVLTGITVMVSFVDLGGFNVVVALVIASIKAMLVALFFMHLYYDDKINMVIFFAALTFLTIFLILTMFDTQTRGQVNPETKSPINKEAVIYQQSTPGPETGTGH